MDSISTAGTKRLVCTGVPDWPRLAWVAVVQRNANAVAVFHGRCVETSPIASVEAVWTGRFAEMDFDLSDIVIGTGIRVRDDGIRFVSSSDTLNRLHYFEKDDRDLVVSNSLPALLAVAELDLVLDFDYARAMSSIQGGLRSYAREIPSSKGTIRVLYFDNLVVTDSDLVVEPKRTAAPDMDDFATYRDYLFDIAERVGENSRAPERRHLITPLATVSRGYDSPVTAMLARTAGAQHAVTTATARRVMDNLFDLDISDSGAEVAAHLGLSCEVYKRARRDYPVEDAVWASVGNVGDVSLTTFDLPQPLCLLFTGFYGDIVWGQDRHAVEPLSRKTTAGVRLCEARLELGIFNCAPAFWGCQKEAQISALRRRPEMRPWTLGNAYDRPVARRLLEEAGVRRGSFAIKKQKASFNRRYGRPLSVSLRQDFAEFMRRHGGCATPGLVQAGARVLGGLDAVVLSRFRPPLRVSCRDWIELPSPSMFFIWANERRKVRYASALQQLLHRGVQRSHPSRPWHGRSEEEWRALRGTAESFVCSCALGPLSHLTAPAATTAGRFSGVSAGGSEQAVHRSDRVGPLKLAMIYAENVSFRSDDDG